MTRFGLVALVLAAGEMTGCAPDGDAGPDDPTAGTVASAPTDTTPVPDSPAAAPTTVVDGQGTTTSIPPAIPTVPEADSVVAVIAEHPDITVIAELVEVFVGTGQGSVFTQARGLTVLAPTDEAMGGLGDESLLMLTDDPDALARWMASHIAIGAVTVDEPDGGVVLNAAGQSLPVDRAGDVLRIGDDEVVDADLAAGNGVVHVIAGVVEPVS